MILAPRKRKHDNRILGSLLTPRRSDILVLKDPDGYSIQILSQEVDKHMELQEACREVVMGGAQQAMQEISEDCNPVTLEEAGMKVPSTAASPLKEKSPSAPKSPVN